MFKLLKNVECYAPAYCGRKDILIVQGTIYRIEDSIDARYLPEMQVFDCSGRMAWPGLIDQHVHITGGGGEEGPASSVPELMLSDLLAAGVSTVVGVLGADGVTKTMQGLLTKARGLEEEGMNTYIYSGYYSIPAATLTGRVLTDIALIDKVIGAGEIAISDYRSSHPTVQVLKELSSEVMTGGMVGGKAGVLHMHVGDGKAGLKPLFELVESADFPMEMFVPTHLNRNRALFAQATQYNGRGGVIDLTAGERTGKAYSVPDALKILVESGANMGKVTVSSDGNGSMPGSRSAATVKQLFLDIRDCIQSRGLPMETVIRTVTENVARVLKLYPSKGILEPLSDADILILHQDGLEIDKLFIGGELMADGGKPVKRGRYEKQPQQE